MKKILSVFLMACSGLSVCAWSGSGTADDPWQLTETMTAVYDLETHLLKIEGSGPMYVWAGDLDPAPWWGVKDDITAVEISQGVESISDQSFLGCRKLTAITIPPSVKKLDMDGEETESCLLKFGIIGSNTNREEKIRCTRDCWRRWPPFSP